MTAFARRFGPARYQADERYRAALSAFRRRDLVSAKAEVAAAIDLLPTHAEYHAALGFFCLEDKDMTPAKDAFQRALELRPYEMLANYGQGMLAYRDKAWKAAAASFHKALAAQPDRAETQYYLAMVNHRLGQNAEALTWMQSARALFVKAEDQRADHCQAWLREFERLV